MIHRTHVCAQLCDSHPSNSFHDVIPSKCWTPQSCKHAISSTVHLIRQAASRAHGVCSPHALAISQQKSLTQVAHAIEDADIFPHSAEVTGPRATPSPCSKEISSNPSTFAQPRELLATLRKKAQQNGSRRPIRSDFAGNASLEQCRFPMIRFGRYQAYSVARCLIRAQHLFCSRGATIAKPL